MVALFVVERPNKKPVRFSTIGLFNEALDPPVFCCRYDWQREISLVEAGDTVHVDGGTYRVKSYEADLCGVASFSLEAVADESGTG